MISHMLVEVLQVGELHLALDAVHGPVVTLDVVLVVGDLERRGSSSGSLEPDVL